MNPKFKIHIPRFGDSSFNDKKKHKYLNVIVQ